MLVVAKGMRLSTSWQGHALCTRDPSEMLGAGFQSGKAAGSALSVMQGGMRAKWAV